MPNDLRERLFNELRTSWEFWGRDSQMPPPGPWRVWALITGRGYGKTWVQSKFIHRKCATAGAYGFMAARTLKDAKKTIIYHPRAGIIATADASNPCDYKDHWGQVRWANGARCDVVTSEEPDSARGPEYSFGSADEIATWKRTVDHQGNDTWTNLQFSLRSGKHPQMVAGTTPRPVKLVKDLIADGANPESPVIVTHGSMLENAANLAPSFVDYIVKKYTGTRLERQEIEGALLLDVEDAIVHRYMYEDTRVAVAPDLVRVVVGVDPFGGGGDACGIIAVGKGTDDHGYLLADVTTRSGPDQWGKAVVNIAEKHGATMIAVEVNYGGDMCISVVRAAARALNKRCPRLKKVTASKGKHIRFEPTGMMYERGEIHHVGKFDDLEEEIVLFTPEGYEGAASPNHADALVFANAELFPFKAGVHARDLYPPGMSTNIEERAA